jgi:hypothetical protein
VAEQQKDSGAITLADDREIGPRDGKPDRDKERELIKEVRASDIEPYTGLRYLSKLFRFMAVILVMLLVAEIVTGFYTQGSSAIPTLLGEASRLIVLAGVLWGTGDLAHLLIDVGHDVRAGRILMARLAYAAKLAPASLIPGHVQGGERPDRILDREIPRGDLGTKRVDDDNGPSIP